MNNLQRLKKILDEVGPKRIWRPVYTPDNELLFQGIGEKWDGLLTVLDKIDFNGKTVGDLGCNFGYYTFVIKEAGARHVMGIDSDPRVIEGAEILKRLYNVEGVSFQTADIAALTDVDRFDMGIMIDFIGKEMVKNGMIDTFLDVIARMSAKEMILTVRPEYKVEKHLDGDFQRLLHRYSDAYVRGKHFYNLDYIRDRFGREWKMAILSTEAWEFEGKIAVHFRRIPGPKG
jgi:ribosomal protein L11 methyltransferase